MKEGWKKYNLMDICNVTTGKHDANHAAEDGKYRFYTCSSQYVYCNTKRYEGECIILPGNGVNVGESYYYNGEFDAYQRTYVIDKIDKGIIPMFLYYHLQNNWKSEGVAIQYGSATNYIKIGNFKDYIVKAPQTLLEQQSIVDYLDTAFAKIDALKANAEKALNEAKALFQASLEEMLEPKEGWEEKTIKECCTELFAGGDVPKPDVSKNKTHKFTVPIYTNGVENDGLYGYTSNARVYEPAVTISARGTIGATFRRCVPFYPAIRLITAVPNKDLLNIDYLYYALKILTVGNSGTSIPQLTIPNIKNTILHVPPLSEQESIVTVLDTLKSKVDRLQENYDKISQECDALKQAILRQVFE